jgi:hypothetical protein
LLNKLHAFFNPEQFQGWGKKRQYFEGWYFKIVNADESKALAIIPGIAMDAQETAILLYRCWMVKGNSPCSSLRCQSVQTPAQKI